MHRERAERVEPGRLRPDVPSVGLREALHGTWPRPRVVGAPGGRTSSSPTEARRQLSRAKRSRNGVLRARASTGECSWALIDRAGPSGILNTARRGRSDPPALASLNIGGTTRSVDHFRVANRQLGGVGRTASITFRKCRLCAKPTPLGAPPSARPLWLARPAAATRQSIP